MSRLRIRTNYNKRNYESDSKVPKKVFVIAVEGNETEIQYFEGIKNNREYLGIPNIVDIEVLDRYDTNSAPKYVIELLEEYINEGYTDEFIKEFEDILESAQLGDSPRSIIKKYFKGNLPEVTRKVVEQIIYEADKHRIYFEKLKNWGVESKEFCIVFDRDDTKAWDLVSIIKESFSKKYTVVQTNPCFEFWLLLHISDVKNEYDLEEIKRNRRITNKKNYVDTLIPNYNKSKIKFEENYLDKVNIAIEREKDYATDWKDIINNVGSNVGILIEEMRKKS